MKFKEIDEKISYFTNLKISNENRSDIATNNNNVQSLNNKGINKNKLITKKYRRFIFNACFLITSIWMFH